MSSGERLTCGITGGRKGGFLKQNPLGHLTRQFCSHLSVDTSSVENDTELLSCRAPLPPLPTKSVLHPVTSHLTVHPSVAGGQWWPFSGLSALPSHLPVCPPMFVTAVGGQGFAACLFSAQNLQCLPFSLPALETQTLTLCLHRPLLDSALHPCLRVVQFLLLPRSFPRHPTGSFPHSHILPPPPRDI